MGGPDRDGRAAGAEGAAGPGNAEDVEEVGATASPELPELPRPSKMSELPDVAHPADDSELPDSVSEAELDTDRLRRRAAFLRDLAEAKELRARVSPRRTRVARLREALRRATYRNL
ncbi:MAG TPA: hypothetical protein VI076_16545 [Actinopolymorphaceae bacterium]